MHLFGVTVALCAITSTNCIELFHYPWQEIKKARVLCAQNTSLSSDCYHRCALELANIVTPAGDGINPKEVGYFYKNYANECWTSIGAPTQMTCAQGEAFATCFFQATQTADANVKSECMEKHPVENVGAVTMTQEELANNENLACLAQCFADLIHAFNDDGTIDLNCVNPHIDFDFQAASIAKKCEEDNQQEKGCQRKANRYLCLIRGYERAIDDHFQAIRAKANITL